MPSKRTPTSALGLFASVLLLTAASHAQQPAQPSLLESTGTAATIAPVAQTVNPEPGTANPNPDDDIVEMSVFNVNATQDEGYQALNTASGSRLNTALRDTPAAISPFSAQFLADVGATTIEDMLAFGLNVESDTGDSGDVSGDDDGARSAGSQDTRFRIRGMAMDISVDNVQTGNPIDTYNVDRAEVSSGPNSILFGMGSAGGLVALSSKRAHLQRNTAKIQNVLGTWTSPSVTGIPFYRATLDYNIVLIPRKMALRLNSVYQEGGNSSWRKWMGRHDRRINPVLTIKPAKNTTINLNFEVGRLKEGITSAWNLADGVTGWFAAGRPILETFAPSTLPDSIIFTIKTPTGSLYNTVSPVAAYGANTRITLVDNNSTVYDMRQSYASSHAFPGNATNYRLPSNLSSYYYSALGPGAKRDQKFDRYQIVLEQRIGKFNFQFTYDRNKNNSSSCFPQGQDAQLQGDPNSYLSTYNWTGVTGVVSDPYSGQLYVEDRWMKRTLNVKTDALRLTGEYSLNLKKYGRHRLVLNFEHTKNDRYNNAFSETLLDENQRAITNPGTPANVQNYLFRRHYVTEGDFSTYHSSNSEVPLPEIYMNGHLYHSAWVGARTSINHIKRTTETAGLTLQSYLLKNKLVLTAGTRFDNVTFNRATKIQLNNPNDPRIISRSKAWHEWDFDGGWEPSKKFNPYTITAGGVWHATDRLSTFANFSTNRGAPELDGRTVLPDGYDPPLSQGRTLDYGVMFDALANGKLFIRLTKFDTKMKYASTGGGDYADSAALGSTNMYNIYDALYFLDVTNQTSSPNTTPFSIGSSIVVNPGPGAGPMPASMYAAHLPTDSLPYGTPPSYNAGLYDTHSSGYEAELTANFTKNFTMRIGFSWTQQERPNIFNEIFDFYNTNIPVWLAMAKQHNPNSPDGQYWVRVPGSSTNVNNASYYTLYDYLWQQLYIVSTGNNLAVGGGNGGANGTSVRQGLISRVNNVAGAMGARPIKITIATSYTFDKKSFLKGFAIGGNVRYSSRNLIPDPNRLVNMLAYEPAEGTDGSEGLAIDRSVFTDMATMVKGNSLVFWSGFARYKCKLFGGRTTASFQFNVANIFNQNVVSVSRYNVYQVATRVNVNAPRTFRLTATFEF